MRISDWSSDVCSSDLFAEHAVWRSVLDQKRERITRFDAAPLIFRHGYLGRFAEGTGTAEITAEPTAEQSDFVLGPIGRASGRESVCQYVSVSVGAGSLETHKYMRNTVKKGEIK